MARQQVEKLLVLIIHVEHYSWNPEIVFDLKILVTTWIIFFGNNGRKSFTNLKFKFDLNYTIYRILSKFQTFWFTNSLLYITDSGLHSVYIHSQLLQRIQDLVTTWITLVRFGSDMWTDNLKQFKWIWKINLNKYNSLRISFYPTIHIFF